MPSVLLPTDFSENSINAIHYAINMYQDKVCDFYLLHVVKASSYISDDLLTKQPTTTIYAHLVKDARLAVERIVKDMKATYQNTKHRFHTIIDYDNFVDAINQTIPSQDIELIIMGTKGATNTEGILFGSNAVRVMQRAVCPVLTVPNPYAFRPINNVGFMSSFNMDYGKDTLSPLINLAQTFKSQVWILHLDETPELSESQEKNKAILDETLSATDHDFVSIEGNSLYQAVTHFMELRNVNLLSMVNKKHSFFERLFTRHEVERFAFKIPVPLLILQLKGQKK
ncbi:universal stress protein [Mangrovimonas aestuarii]|uniref:universal stress protein n=1 Tax=Mangrovimonas aestuarii TaxID=3018443 RepID=UPI002378AF42|nr:universal stress protein [Mangrovimonas aestuarii]